MLLLEVPGAGQPDGEEGTDRRADLTRMLAGQPVCGLVRPAIIDSWRRALAVGLAPERFAPPGPRPIDECSTLTRAAAPVVDRLAEDLYGTGISIVLTDADGLIVRRAVPDGREANRLDDIMLRPGYLWDFRHAGTNGLSLSMVTGTPSWVKGDEHFYDALTRMASVAAPIRDPRTAQVVGTLGLVCDLAAANPLLLPMVCLVSREVEQGLAGARTAGDRVLEEAFLHARRGTRGPVAVVSQGALLSNAAAARLLAPTDQARLWNFVSYHLRLDEMAECQFALTDGSALQVSLEAVLIGGEVAGVVVRALAASRRAMSSRRRPVSPYRPTFGWDSLTATELTVTDLVSEGLTNRQVANKLWLSPHTVDAHLRHVFQKLGINSRVELVRMATTRALAAPRLDGAAAVA
jgi:transcriptional regulator of acetoin/glycerol metabolism/DNA-binding CsgD family transcriptional regulator